jgi:LAO/AO transport system kinase
MRGSALRAEGLDQFWSYVQEFKRLRDLSGEFGEKRRQQALTWMWDQVHARLAADFRDCAAVRAALPAVLVDVSQSRIAPSSAARKLLDLFEKRESTHA